MNLAKTLHNLAPLLSPEDAIPYFRKARDIRVKPGEVPFRGAPHLVLQQILREEPRPPSRLQDDIP